jgi:hypothetical protein
MTGKSSIAIAQSERLAESRLWQAVIVNTIQEWISGPLRFKRQAEEYIFGNNSDFRVVCQSAGMDADQLRKKLTRIRPAPAGFAQK